MDSHAMIAFLPADGSWCKQDLPHMTLVYAGKTEDLMSTDFNAMAKEAVMVARLTGTFSLPVTGVEEFGPEGDKVDVLTFHPSPQLLLARRMVEKWNASEFKDYKPHATIGPAGSASQAQDPYSEGYSSKNRSTLPLSVYFNKVGAFWGDQKLLFDLGEF